MPKQDVIRATFGVDASGKHWAYAPKDFDERRHFIYCSVCKLPMYLTHGDPKEAAYYESSRVEGYSGPQIP